MPAGWAAISVMGTLIVVFLPLAVVNPCAPVIPKDPLPLMVRVVTPTEPPVPPLNTPAVLMALFTVMVIVPGSTLPAVKTARLAVFQTTGEAVNVLEVAHWALVVSQVPLVGADSPFGSQK